MKMFFLTSFTKYCLSLWNKGFSLLWLNSKLFKISILISRYSSGLIFVLLWTKVIFHEITNTTMKVKKKTHSIIKFRKSWISHAWRTVHWSKVRVALYWKLVALLKICCQMPSIDLIKALRKQEEKQ